MPQPQGDLSEFDAKQKVKKIGARLRVDILLEDELPPDKADVLRKALAGEYRHAVIAEVVNDWGYVLADESVRTWRLRHQTQS